MKRILSKSSLSLTIVLVFALAFVQAPASCSNNATNEETARAFMENMIELDVSKYEINLKTQTDSVDKSGVTENTLLYTLKSKGSTIDVMCIFRNNSLVTCITYPIEGSPAFTRSTADTLDLAKRFLDNYQTELKANYVESLRNMLNNVTEIKPLSITSNDVKLTIVRKDYEYIEWMETPNGIHNMYNQITLIFQNGTLKLFSDHWNRYPIGSADASISEEQAINIAKERVKSYSYAMENATVDNLAVNEKSNWTHAELTMEPRGDALYPRWEVYLPLDRLYPGMVTSIRVTLWADTGDIESIHETTLGGMPQGESSSAAETETPQPSDIPFNNQTQTENTDNNPIVNVEIIAGVAIVAMMIAVVAVAEKKRKK
jgi:hypothetical protein